MLNVYKKNQVLSSVNNLSLENDQLLYNTIKSALLINLLFQQLSLMKILNKEELLELLKDIKRQCNNLTSECYNFLLNTEWHKTIFQEIEIKNNDAQIWYIINKINDIYCIYEGEKYINEDVFDGNCLLLSNKINGPECLQFKINENNYLNINFPIITIKINNNFYDSINDIFNSILISNKYNITKYCYN